MRASAKCLVAAIGAWINYKLYYNYRGISACRSIGAIQIDDRWYYYHCQFSKRATDYGFAYLPQEASIFIRKAYKARTKYYAVLERQQLFSIRQIEVAKLNP